MRKSIFVALFTAGILFSGCSFDFFGLYPQSQPKKEVAVSGAFKATIVNYTRNNKFSYLYKFKEFGTQKNFTAHSNRYYYNSGDTVNVHIKNGTIVSMNVISRKPNPNASKSYTNERIDRSKQKKIKKNNSISVPATENISF